MDLTGSIKKSSTLEINNSVARFEESFTAEANICSNLLMAERYFPLLEEKTSFACIAGYSKLVQAQVVFVKAYLYKVFHPVTTQLPNNYVVVASCRRLYTAYQFKKIRRTFLISQFVLFRIKLISHRYIAGNVVEWLAVLFMAAKIVHTYLSVITLLPLEKAFYSNFPFVSETSTVLATAEDPSATTFPPTNGLAMPGEYNT